MHTRRSIAIFVLVLALLSVVSMAHPFPDALHKRDYEPPPWQCTRKWGNILVKKSDEGNDIWYLDRANQAYTGHLHPNQREFAIVAEQGAAGIFLMDFCQDYTPTYIICLVIAFPVANLGAS